MAEIPAATAQKLRKLLEAQRDLLAKFQAIQDEVDTLLGGGVTIGQQLDAMKRAWNDVWTTRYAGPYRFDFKRDVPTLKRLIKEYGPAELEQRMAAYLKDGDRGLVENKHPFQWFSPRINRYAEAAGSHKEFSLEQDADVERTRAMLRDRAR